MGGEAPRGSHFALEVDDVAAAGAELAARGVAHDLNTRPDGAAQIFLRDPDGHCVELTAPPSD